MRAAYQVSILASIAALSIVFALQTAEAKKAPEERCGIDRKRICGTKSKAQCDLRQHIEGLSPACLGRLEKKGRKKTRRKIEKQ